MCSWNHSRRLVVLPLPLQLPLPRRPRGCCRVCVCVRVSAGCECSSGRRTSLAPSIIRFMLIRVYYICAQSAAAAADAAASSNISLARPRNHCTGSRLRAPYPAPPPKRWTRMPRSAISRDERARAKPTRCLGAAHRKRTGRGMCVLHVCAVLLMCVVLTAREYKSRTQNRRTYLAYVGRVCVGTGNKNHYARRSGEWHLWVGVWAAHACFVAGAIIFGRCAEVIIQTSKKS